MLDASADLSLFKVILPSKEVRNEALVIVGCEAFIRDKEDKESIVYSEIDALNYSYFNANDYGTCAMEIEFLFENNSHKPYHNFYAGCFAIRTENGFRLRTNGRPKKHFITKINKDNRMVLGVGFYFESIDHYNRMKACNFVAIEGFFALDKYSNTYQLVCKLEKVDGKWSIMTANTYKMDKKGDIRGYKH